MAHLRAHVVCDMCAGRASQAGSSEHSASIKGRPQLGRSFPCRHLSRPQKAFSHVSWQCAAASGSRDSSSGGNTDAGLDASVASTGSKAGSRWSRARSELNRIRGGAGSELNRWRGAQQQDGLATSPPLGAQTRSQHGSAPVAQQRSGSGEGLGSSGDGPAAQGAADKPAAWTPSSVSSVGTAAPAGGAASVAQQQPALSQRTGHASGNGGSSGAANSSGISAPVSSVEQPYPQQPAGDVLLELRNVYKSFGTKDILRGASMQIRRGEAVGIIGGSGTGKSTTLRLMAGLLAPDRGEVVVQGVPRRGLASDDTSIVKRKCFTISRGLQIGMVFQSGALFDSLSVGENVGFLLYEHSNLPEARIKQLVARSLAAVGLSGVEGLLPSELSGGMKKRVALARAIIRDDENDAAEQVIMYDEPTAGLDPVASTVVEDLIRSLQNKGGPAQSMKGGISSYIVVTHQHSTIRRSVDRLIFLHEGTVVWTGTNQEFEETEEPIVKQFRTGSLGGPIKYE